jgi:Mrp family chromosome partitioning ATPase
MKTLDRLKQDELLMTEMSKFETRLWRQTRLEHMRTVLLTSAVRAEGKSTTAAYLATAMGLFPGRNILVADFDFRSPSVASLLGLSVPCGVDRVLSGDAPLLEAIVKSDLPGLHLLAPSARGADPELLLDRGALREIFKPLRAKYDLILIDSPALLPAVYPTTIMSESDGIILVAMAGRTTEHQLRRAIELCQNMDANLLGLAVGNVKEAAPEYYANKHDYSSYGREADELQPLAESESHRTREAS